MGRFLALVCLLAGLSNAAEKDASVAAAGRWVEPRGCASGSHRSLASPVVTEIEQAWRLELTRIEAPPVHWDGRGYVVGRDGPKAVLVAFDLRSGRELARTRLKGYVQGAGLFVWDHMVLVQPDVSQINGYRLESGKLKPVWIFRGRRIGSKWRHPRDPIVHDNEVYCILGDSLARIRPGSKFPAWLTLLEFDWANAHRPAVYGPYVFLVMMSSEPITVDDEDSPEIHGKKVSDLWLGVWRRSDGRLVTQRQVCQAIFQPQTPVDLELTVSEKTVYIGSNWPLLSTGGHASHVMVPMRMTRESVSLAGRVGLWSYELAPADHALGRLVLSSKENKLEWRLHGDGRLALLTSKATQPYLFEDRVPPTILGDVVYFGSWAADLETREILWRLPFKDVSYSVVPADGLFLVVEQRRVLRAFRGRGKK